MLHDQQTAIKSNQSQHNFSGIKKVKHKKPLKCFLISFV